MFFFYCSPFWLLNLLFKSMCRHSWEDDFGWVTLQDVMFSLIVPICQRAILLFFILRDAAYEMQQSSSVFSQQNEKWLALLELKNVIIEKIVWFRTPPATFQEFSLWASWEAGSEWGRSMLVIHFNCPVLHAVLGGYCSAQICFEEALEKEGNRPLGYLWLEWLVFFSLCNEISFQ